MKQKTKLDIIYSSISILDAIITMGFFFLSGNFVIENIPDDFTGLLLFVVYILICLGSCLIRNSYLLKRYLNEITKLEEKQNRKDEKSYCVSIYLFPLFAMVSCIISLCVIIG